MHSSRMRTARNSSRLRGGGIPCIPGGVSACPSGVCLPGGRWVVAQGGPAWGVYHVTYPIMHLMLPVCCLHTN